VLTPRAEALRGRAACAVDGRERDRAAQSLQSGRS
jgi:hypothetical protein